MGLSRNDRSIATFTMLAHAVVHWFELAIPIFLVVWLDAFDVSLAAAGFAVAAGYAPFGLGALPAGVLVDRFGPRRLVLGCLAGASLAFAALAVAPSIYAVGATLFVWGTLASVYHPAGLALISTGVRDRGAVFAWHGIAGNLGIALGPLVAATLLLVFEWRLVALLLAAPGVLVAVYGLRVPFDPTAAIARDDAAGTGAGDAERSRSSAGFVAASRSLLASSFLAVFVIVTLVGVYYRGTLTYLPELLGGLSAFAAVEPPAGLESFSLAEYVFVGLLVAGMAGQYVAGKLTRRVSAARGVLACFVVLAALALAYAPVSGGGLTLLVGYCVVFGFALFAIEPFYQEAVAVYTPPDARGLAYGYTYLGMFGLGTSGIAVGGFLLDHGAGGAFFALLAGVALVGTTVAATLRAGSTRGEVVQGPIGPRND